MTGQGLLEVIHMTRSEIVPEQNIELILVYSQTFLVNVLAFVCSEHCKIPEPSFRRPHFATDRGL